MKKSRATLSAALRTALLLPAVSGALVITIAAASAADQPYPARPIRVVVPSQAGGGADIIARAIAARMTEAWGRQVVVDNRLGVVGGELVANATPDGYTLMFTTSALVVREVTYHSMPFAIMRNFQPLSQSVTQANLLVVNPALPAKNVQDLVNLAKARPGALNFGSGGNGTSAHLACELFGLLAGIKVVHIPYKGVPMALADTVAGRVQFIVGSPVSTLPYVKEGRLRLLAVTTPRRSATLPDVPTVAETVPGYEFTGWMGWFAPRGLSPAIAETIHREAARIVQLPDVKQRFQADATEPVGSSPAQFTAFLKEELARWGKVARAAKIEID